jgi:hypothetical protein
MPFKRNPFNGAGPSPGCMQRYLKEAAPVKRRLSGAKMGF